MNVSLVIALVLVGVFVAILVTLALTRNDSEPDSITHEVVRQGLTGPVPLSLDARHVGPKRKRPGTDDETT